jgi:hypothetical protein
MSLKGILPGPFLSFSVLPAFHEVSSCVPFYPFHDVSSLPCHGLKALVPANYGQKLLKPKVKTNLSSFKLFLSGICHSDGKSE